MSGIEVIEKLCMIVELQSEIINKQAETLAQADISKAVAKDLEKMRKEAAELAAFLNEK